jgi:DNA repair protein RadD
MGRVVLRPYQLEVISQLEDAYKVHSRVLLQLPTGLGKTVIAAEMARRTKGITVFVVHRKELLEQAVNKFKEIGLEVGTIIAGCKPDVKPVTVAMIQTLARRDEILTGLQPDLVILDESHLTSSNSYQKVVKAWTEPKLISGWNSVQYPKTKLLGLTATPCRLDGKALSLSFEKLVEGPDVEWGINNGFLADYVVYGSTNTPSTQGVKTSMGDFSATELETRVNTIEIAGAIVRDYQKHLDGKQAIVFCVTVRHARELAAQFVLAGIPAACLDGEMGDSERKRLIDDYRAGKILVLTNVNICIEGLDVPDVQGVIFARPTKSMVVYRQAIGRGLRPKSRGEKLIVLDHVGNTQRLGFPDEKVAWSLEGRAIRGGGERTIGMKVCKTCLAMNRSEAKVCLACETIFPLVKREVIEGNRELVALEKKSYKPLKAWSVEFWSEVRRTHSMKELREIALRAGFKGGFGYYLYKAFVEEKRVVPVEGYVKL